MNNLKVLLVDDEIMIREGFKKLFDWEAHGCQVVGEAADGMEAVNMIEKLLPDLVIMDINIPIMNGLQVIKVSRMKHPDMAFVVVSGYDSFEYCQQAVRLKITDYILKPVDYDAFGDVIDNLKIAMFRNRLNTNPDEPKNERVIYAITAYIQENMAQDISLSSLADQFHLSSQYISQLFKNEVGVNYLAYLTNIRIENARKLLLSTDDSIAEIAEKCGFNDYRVFTKVFKKNEKMTPSEYRKVGLL